MRVLCSTAVFIHSLILTFRQRVLDSVGVRFLLETKLKLIRTYIQLHITYCKICKKTEPDVWETIAFTYS